MTVGPFKTSVNFYHTTWHHTSQVTTYFLVTALGILNLTLVCQHSASSQSQRQHPQKKR